MNLNQSINISRSILLISTVIENITFLVSHGVSVETDHKLHPHKVSYSEKWKQLIAFSDQSTI